MNKLFLAGLLIMIMAAPLAVSAQTLNPCAPQEGVTPSIGVCVSRIYVWSLAAAAVLALLMMVFGGYQVMTAAGNAQQATSGKEYITSSIIGLALLFGAYLILNTINPDLVDFNVSGLETTTPAPATPGGSGSSGSAGSGSSGGGSGTGGGSRW